MNKIIIKNCKIVSGGKIKEGSIEIENGILKKIGKNINFLSDTKNIDAEGNYLSSGFIDIHVNGGNNYDFLNSDKSEFIKIINFHNYYGTTSLLPTITAAPLKKMINFLDVLKLVSLENNSILGAHLNGPFLSEKKRGAIKLEYLKKPDVNIVRELEKNHSGLIKIMTIAPELDGIEKIIKELKVLNIIPSIGHTDATFADIIKVKKLGVKHFTHFFNAMRGFHHREPGCVGAGLIERDMTFELSVDGFNVIPVVINFLLQVRDIDYVSVITDATSSAGMPDGKYKLSETEVIKKDCIVLDNYDNFAGSAITMDLALKNFINFSGLPLEKAINALTLNPARVLGIDNQKGSIDKGKDADIIIIDENLDLKSVALKGKFIRLENKIINFNY
ncbi:MAG: N-acetylglucosamine-6-phosphate deacetylase [Candidatus Humimicrobiaceae bacterium]